MSVVVVRSAGRPAAGGMAVGKMLSRKKTMAGVVRETSQLDRVLTATDLTALGVGSTIGVGVYVLPGSLSKYVAGPAIVLSFFFAAVASAFAGEYAHARVVAAVTRGGCGGRKGGRGYRRGRQIYVDSVGPSRVFFSVGHGDPVRVVTGLIIRVAWDL